MKNFQANQMICEQTYPGDEDYIAHFNWCLQAFRDHRYTKVDGKPFFLLYNAQDLPDCHHFFDLWNDLAIKAGFPGMHFVGLVGGWDSEIPNLFSLGYDAVVHGNIWQAEALVKGKYLRMVKRYILDRFDKLSLDKYSYKEIVNHMLNKCDYQDNIYPCILPGWDRSPRSGRRAVIYYGSTPEIWKQHVSKAVEAVQSKPEEHRIIVLRSWNEWGEGNYVEPDERWGTSYLDCLREVLF